MPRWSTPGGRPCRSSTSCINDATSANELPISLSNISCSPFHFLSISRSCSRKREISCCFASRARELSASVRRPLISFLRSSIALRTRVCSSFLTAFSRSALRTSRCRKDVPALMSAVEFCIILRCLVIATYGIIANGMMRQLRKSACVIGDVISGGSNDLRFCVLKAGEEDQEIAAGDEGSV